MYVLFLLILYVNFFFINSSTKALIFHTQQQGGSAKGRLRQFPSVGGFPAVRAWASGRATGPRVLPPQASQQPHFMGEKG